MNFYLLFRPDDRAFWHDPEVDAVSLLLDEDTAEEMAASTDTQCLDAVVYTDRKLLKDFIGLLGRKLDIAMVVGDHTLCKMIESEGVAERALLDIAEKDPRIQRAYRNSERRDRDGSATTADTSNPT